MAILFMATVVMTAVVMTAVVMTAVVMTAVSTVVVVHRPRSQYRCRCCSDAVVVPLSSPFAVAFNDAVTVPRSALSWTTPSVTS
ncbi:hypothetical protein [Streptomyces sp. NPDC002324]